MDDSSHQPEHLMSTKNPGNRADQLNVDSRVPMRAASKTFRTEVRYGNENYNDVPSVVEFSIDEATAAQIIRLAAIVKCNGLYKVEKFDYRARYLKHDPEQDPQDAELAGEENEFRTEADVLNVSDTEFWFSAYIRHTDIEVVS